MRTSETTTEIYKAFIEAQAEMPSIAKGRENPFYHSSYAGLPDIVKAVNPVLSMHDLAVIQGGGDQPNELTMRIIHTSGEWIEASIHISPLKDDPQAVGSAWTYGRRYLYCAMMGIAPDGDDDGNAASDKPVTKKPASKPVTKDAPNKAEQHMEPSGDEPVNAIIKQTSEKNGKSKEGKPYTKYGILMEVDGMDMWTNTFDAAIYEEARSIKGQEVRVALKQTKFGWDLMDIFREAASVEDVTVEENESPADDLLF